VSITAKTAGVITDAQELMSNLVYGGREGFEKVMAVA
jgi:hypothetical protein